MKMTDKNQGLFVVTRSRYKDLIDFDYDLCSKNDKELYTREELNPNNGFNCIEIVLARGSTDCDCGNLNTVLKDHLENPKNSIPPYTGRSDDRSAIDFVRDCEENIMVYLDRDSHKVSAFLKLLEGDSLYWAKRKAIGKRYRNLRDDFIDEFYDKEYQERERSCFISCKYPEYEGQLVSEFISFWTLRLEFNCTFYDFHDTLFKKLPPIYYVFLAEKKSRIRSRAEDYELVKKVILCERMESLK